MTFLKVVGALGSLVVSVNGAACVPAAGMNLGDGYLTATECTHASIIITAGLYANREMVQAVTNTSADLFVASCQAPVQYGGCDTNATEYGAWANKKPADTAVSVAFLDACADNRQVADKIFVAMALNIGSGPNNAVPMSTWDTKMQETCYDNAVLGMYPMSCKPFGDSALDLGTLNPNCCHQAAIKASDALLASNQAATVTRCHAHAPYGLCIDGTTIADEDAREAAEDAICGSSCETGVMANLANSNLTANHTAAVDGWFDANSDDSFDFCPATNYTAAQSVAGAAQCSPISNYIELGNTQLNSVECLVSTVFVHAVMWDQATLLASMNISVPAMLTTCADPSGALGGCVNATGHASGDAYAIFPSPTAAGAALAAICQNNHDLGDRLASAAASNPGALNSLIDGMQLQDKCMNAVTQLGTDGLGAYPLPCVTMSGVDLGSLVPRCCEAATVMLHDAMASNGMSSMLNGGECPVHVVSLGSGCETDFASLPSETAFWNAGLYMCSNNQTCGDSVLTNLGAANAGTHSMSAFAKIILDSEADGDIDQCSVTTTTTVAGGVAPPNDDDNTLPGSQSSVHCNQFSDADTCFTNGCRWFTASYEAQITTNGYTGSGSSAGCHPCVDDAEAARYSTASAVTGCNTASDACACSVTMDGCTLLAQGMSEFCPQSCPLVSNSCANLAASGFVSDVGQIVVNTTTNSTSSDDEDDNDVEVIENAVECRPVPGLINLGNETLTETECVAARVVFARILWSRKVTISFTGEDPVACVNATDVCTESAVTSNGGCETNSTELGDYANILPVYPAYFHGANLLCQDGMYTSDKVLDALMNEEYIADGGSFNSAFQSGWESGMHERCYYNTSSTMMDGVPGPLPCSPNGADVDFGLQTVQCCISGFAMGSPDAPVDAFEQATSWACNETLSATCASDLVAGLKAGSGADNADIHYMFDMTDDGVNDYCYNATNPPVEEVALLPGEELVEVQQQKVTVPTKIPMTLTPAQETAMKTSTAVKSGLRNACIERYGDSISECLVNSVDFEAPVSGRRRLSATERVMVVDYELTIQAEDDTALAATLSDVKTEAASTDTATLQSFETLVQDEIAKEVAALPAGSSDSVASLPASEQLTADNLDSMVQTPLPTTESDISVSAVETVTVVVESEVTTTSSTTTTTVTETVTATEGVVEESEAEEDDMMMIYIIIAGAGAGIVLLVGIIMCMKKKSTTETTQVTPLKNDQGAAKEGGRTEFEV